MSQGETYTVQVGNSDDKLTQVEWADFVDRTRELIADHFAQVHFFATSEGSRPWQNAVIVFELDANRLESLKSSLRELRQRYNQESVAFTAGTTEFI